MNKTQYIIAVMYDPAKVDAQKVHACIEKINAKFKIEPDLSNIMGEYGAVYTVYGSKKAVDIFLCLDKIKGTDVVSIYKGANDEQAEG